VRETPEAAAQRLGEQGDYTGAAQAFQSLAGQTRVAETQQHYAMSAVEYWLKANRVDLARQQIPALQAATPLLQWRLQLAYARLELADNQPAAAQTRLDALGQATIPAEVRDNYLDIRALALETQGQYLQAARARSAREESLRNSLEIKTNQQALWQNLMRLSPAQLGQPPQDSEARLQGWMNLAWLAKTNPPSQLPVAVQGWQQRYPQHPAMLNIVPMLVGTQTAGAGQPQAARQIALLLPLNGELMRAAEAVREGFLAAWYNDGGDRQGVAVKVYEADQNNVLQVYQQALDEGAYLVAGPLNKDAVSTLVAAYPSFPVPTLSLNYHIELSQGGSYTAPGNLYQFSLSAEDEARVVAALAWADGKRRAVALVPEGDWGNRVLGSFARHWESQGGELVGHTAYRDNFSEAARQLLRERASIDMIFIGAFPSQARQIRPHLKYYAAGNLPVYATSHVYGGTPEVTQDKDLDGVLFVDMPWLITPPAAGNPLYAPVAQYWRDWPAANKRLYAFGIDAYRLASRLPQLQAQTRIEGETGLLWLDRLGVIHRELPRAVFRNGVPVAYDDRLAAPPAPTPAP
jgi:outer membrane PBP1 activator LpoA protein